MHAQKVVSWMKPHRKAGMWSLCLWKCFPGWSSWSMKRHNFWSLKLFHPYYPKSRHDITPLAMVNIQSNHLSILNLNKCMNGRGGLESLMHCWPPKFVQWQICIWFQLRNFSGSADGVYFSFCNKVGCFVSDEHFWNSTSLLRYESITVSRIFWPSVGYSDFSYWLVDVVHAT